MHNERAIKNQSELPLGVALALLGVVIVGLLYCSMPAVRPTIHSLFQSDLESFYESNLALLTLTVVALTLNIVGIHGLGSQLIGLRRQGSRLEVLTGQKKKNGSLRLKDGAIGLTIAITSFLFLHYTRLAEMNFASVGGVALELQTALSLVMHGNFSVSLGFLAILALRSGWIRHLTQDRCKSLSSFPRSKNSVVLGSAGEESPEQKPEWVELKRKALNGNVLITGSIGTGKTQGAILPFLDQILGNFDPRPSILAIDPKRTFIAEALPLIQKHGLGEHVLHLRLGGEVTFNPIYQERALKSSRFLDVAQMIRAAAVNYMGKSFDSPFWENSAFNLAKNCLVFCAATRGYYTLKDLYTSMVRAASTQDEFTKELKAALERDEFDAEEKFNIKCAIEYFESEYQQLDDKVRTGILATSTSFLNQFQEYQASLIFCPPLEKLTIKSMNEVVDGGKFLLFDISCPGLAKSMGTFIKLHYEQSILDRLVDRERGKERSGVLIVDEYQDVVTTGYGATIGDDRFLAKGREANSISIVAFQSLASLENSIGREKPTQELFQNFRTKILGHSSDLSTIRLFQELVGQEDRKRKSHSVSEYSQHAKRNLIAGGFESSDANISESISTSEQKEYVVTGKELSRLATFECFAQIYDGVTTEFKKLFLKPYYLAEKATAHSQILRALKAASLTVALGLAGPSESYAFPSVCSVTNTSEFRSCLDFKVGGCMCGWPVPRPCAQISYYIPKTFVEVMPDPRQSFFSTLPGAAIQLGSISKLPIPYGVESDNATHAFQAHTIAVPFTMIPFSTLPCGEATVDRLCFDGMSEHLGSHWETGSGDLLQPKFLAWSLSPKGCLIAGALSSGSGETGSGFSPAKPLCSVSMAWLPKYPPSSHAACTGWGIFYPRTGTYNGVSQSAAALMVAARMKSLSSDVFLSTPSSPDEVWQMISPQSSSCFREGQNVGLLETIKGVRETERLNPLKKSGYLFVVWSKVSCCRDLALVPSSYIAIEAMQLACKAVDGL